MLKDPDAKLPFTVDWSQWLANEGDTAASATWMVPAGLVQESTPLPSLANGKATVWISGGTAGQDYLVTCRLVTTGGKIDDRTFRIKVIDR